MAIVAVTLEFRELLDGWFALYAIGPDGKNLNVWQHPNSTRGDAVQMLRYYGAVAGTGLLEGVTPEMLAAELVKFMPRTFGQFAQMVYATPGVARV